jgi:hypothetical protein
MISCARTQSLSNTGEVYMVPIKPQTVFLLGFSAFVLGVSATTAYFLPRVQRAEAAADRLEQIRASIREANNPRPINCEPYISQPWAGRVLLKDWPKGEPVPEVCHLRPEVERLGLVPKSPI